MKIRKQADRVVLTQSNPIRKSTLNLGGILCLILSVYGIYYALIKGKFLPFSIASVLSWSHPKTWHVIAVAVVPIYLALIIFGVALLSFHLGSALQRWLLCQSQRKSK